VGCLSELYHMYDAQLIEVICSHSTIHNSLRSQIFTLPVRGSVDD
jgi:hypothetical protein